MDLNKSINENDFKYRKKINSLIEKTGKPEKECRKAYTKFKGQFSDAYFFLTGKTWIPGSHRIK